MRSTVVDLSNVRAQRAGLPSYAEARGWLYLSTADRILDYDNAVAACDVEALAALGLSADDIEWHTQHPGARMICIAP